MPHEISLEPGPSQVHFSCSHYIKKAFNENLCSISHRSSKFQDIYSFTEHQLRQVLNVPDHFNLLFLSSATDIWERIIQNFVPNSSHHFINGAFSQRFYDFAINLGKNSSFTEGQPGLEFESFCIPDSTDLIAVTMNETSTGYAFRSKQLKKLRYNYNNKLIAVDAVSSAAAVPLDWDTFDMTYFSVQKCFGLPAGLGVWILNDKSIERYFELKEKYNLRGTYRSLDSLIKSAKKNQTPETPNVLNIYLLGKIAFEMNKKGISHIQNDIIYKKTLLYKTLTDHPWLTPHIKIPENRSKTVIVSDCSEYQAEILKYFNSHSIRVGKGYGDFKDSHIRIANFPAHSKETIEYVVDLFQKIG